MFILNGFIDFLTVYVRKPRFLVMIGVIVSCVLIMEAVYGERVVSNIPTYIIDLDNSSISRTVRTFLESSPDLNILGAIDTPQKAEEAFLDSQAAAIVFIPDGLAQSVKRQEGGHIFTYLDGSSLIRARNADKAIQTVVKSTSVGVSMITLNKQGVPDFALMGALQPINFDVDRPFNAMTVYSEYLLPVLTFFCLNIFICIMTCAVFQEALPESVEKHKIRRRFFYFGRLCAIFFIALIGGVILCQYGLPRVDIVLQSTPMMAISALVVYIVLTEAMFANINLVLPISFGMSASFLLCMLSVMLSGLTWPLEMMPWYIQEFAEWIPLTPFLQSIQVFLYHDANWADLSDFGIMFLKQAILWLLLAFIIMRGKDVKMFAVWLWRRKHSRMLAAATPSGAQAVAVPLPIATTPKDDFDIAPKSTQTTVPSEPDFDIDQKSTQANIPSEPDFDIAQKSAQANIPSEPDFDIDQKSAQANIPSEPDFDIDQKSAQATIPSEPDFDIAQKSAQATIPSEPDFDIAQSSNTAPQSPQKHVVSQDDANKPLKEPQR